MHYSCVSSLILENYFFFEFLFHFDSIGYNWCFDKFYLNPFSLLGEFCNILSLNAACFPLWKLKSSKFS